MAQQERAEEASSPRERSVQRALQFTPTREKDASLITSSTRKPKRREPAAPPHTPPAKRAYQRQLAPEQQRVEDLASPELRRRKSAGDAAATASSESARAGDAAPADVPAPPIPQVEGRPASEPPRSKMLQLLSPVYNLLRPGGRAGEARGEAAAGQPQENAPAGGSRRSLKRKSRSKSPEQLQMAPAGTEACAAPPPEALQPQPDELRRPSGAVAPAGAAAAAAAAAAAGGRDGKQAASEGASSTDGESETFVGTRLGGARHWEEESDGASGPGEAQQLAAAAEATQEDDEEGDFLEFDPYAFIKSLPPLSQCAPAWRRCLLPKQTRQCKRKTLVLDLDETLVHSSLEATAAPDFCFTVAFNGRRHAVAVRRRPHLAAFLERCAQLFEVVIFTASQKLYAEQLLNILDPERRLIRHRIFRDACLVYEGNYLKDLTVLGRDLAHTLIVDNSPQAFGFQLANGVPIESWYDDASDRELLRLLPFLESLVDVPDVRPVIADAFQLHKLVARAPRY